MKITYKDYDIEIDMDAWFVLRINGKKFQTDSFEQMIRKIVLIENGEELTIQEYCDKYREILKDITKT